MAKKNIGLKIEEEYIKKLKKIAEKDGRSLSSLIRKVLIEYLEKEEEKK